MKPSIELNLSLKDCRILDQMLVQAMGYPIESMDDKLGFSRRDLDPIFQKVRAIAYNSSDGIQDLLVLNLSREELIQVVRAVAIAFIETGPNSDLSTVTGYSVKEVEEMYEKINMSLLK